MHTVAVDNPSYDIPGEGPIVDQGADYKPEAVPVAISSHPTLEEMQASPGIFTNERGNLKVVSCVSRCPCISLLLVYVVAITLTIILGVVLSGDAGADGFGALFTEAAQYDIGDIRSLRQDSFTTAMKAISDLKAEEEKKQSEDVKEKPMTQQVGAFIIMYEASSDADYNIFNENAAKAIREIEDIANKEPDFDKWCKRADTPGDAEGPCTTTDVSPLKFLYPSSFDNAKVQEVVDGLKNDEVRKAYIFLEERCVQFSAGGLIMNVSQPSCNCGRFPTNMQTECQSAIARKQTVQELADKIRDIVSKFDGKGTEPVKQAYMKTLAAFVAYMHMLPAQMRHFDFHVDKEFNTTNPKSAFSRSIISIGGPLRGYKNTEDRADEQEKKMKKYVVDKLEGKMYKASKGSYGDYGKYVSLYYFMTALIFEVFIKILQNDGLLALASIGMVFTYVWIVTGSLFLAMVGMSEILLSISAAWFIIRCIFQVKYFAGLNMMCIFIVCAIGADDIFVFMDAYVQSQYKGPGVNRDMETRFSWVYRKSGLAMLITSVTTCVAFLCCFATPLSDTQAFGLFAAAVIWADYMFVMSMFCTAVMVYHNHLEKSHMCGCSVPTPMGSCVCGCCIENCDCSKSDPSPTQKALAASSGVDDRPRDNIEIFFREKFAPLILNVKARVVIAIVMLAWLIPAIIYVFKLVPTAEPEQFLNENHPFQKAINVWNRNFGANSQDPGIDIFYIWGLEEVDRSGVNPLLDPKFLGKPQYSKDFKFNGACQDKIKQICEDLKVQNTSDPIAEKKRAYSDIIQRDGNAKGSVKCFVHEDLPNYLATKQGANRDEPKTWMADFLRKKRSAKDDEETTKKVEMDFFYNTPGGSRIGWDGNDVKFVAISVEAKEISRWDRPGENWMRQRYEEYDSLSANMDNIAFSACKSKVIMTDIEQKFVFMNNQAVYRTSAIRGALIGVAIAFAVLLAATWSPLVSLFATLSILCTMLSVIGFTTMIGWKLGAIEAILISILAGFSVDYVVHLGHAYSHNYGDKDQRIIETFSEMGSPVFSGMCTSVLASLPLFGCQLQFFAKFGTFLCLTILFSWLFANFGFMSILATIGASKEKKDKGGHT